MLLMLYLVAITAEAMTGALSAGRRGMDWFGVVLIACVTALGGGSVRDVLLGHYPLTWVKHPEYLVLTSVAALVTIFIAPLMRRLRSLFLALDAVGLVAFTLIGCMTALEMGHGMLVASVSGVITGVFGGILRDIFCNDIPLIFRRELYASVSFLAAWLYLLCLYLQLPGEQAIMLTLFSGFLLAPAGDPFSLGNAQVHLQRRRSLTLGMLLQRPFHMFAHQLRRIVPARLQGFQHRNARWRIAQAYRQVAQPALVTCAA